MATLAPYPARLSVDYPDQPRNRMTTFFRVFTVIPIFIVLGAIVSSGNSSAGGYIALPTLLMLLFRQKYPRWWFDFNLALTQFSYRVTAYFLLLRDEYPSTDEEQAVHVELTYPNASTELNRWLPLVKWLLAFPHYIVLFVLGIAAFFCVLIAWFAILFTGQYPRSLFDFVVSVLRWGLRVQAYVYLLTTDVYPPFQLD